MNNICPVCGKETYSECSGEYDTGYAPKKLSPDIGGCTSCGFYYSEHINYPFGEQVEKYKRKWEKERKSLDKDI